MPCVHLSLNPITLGQQGCIFWAKVVHDCIEAFPEIGASYASARKYLLFDEVVEWGGDLKAVARGAGSHAWWAFVNMNK
jgi:hypothetical protein